MITRYRIKYLPVALIVAALAAVSCIRDKVDAAPAGAVDGKVRIELRTNAAASTVPTTRADETTIGPTFVLVYTGTDGTAQFSEAVEAQNITGTGGVTTAAVTLTKTTEQCRFVVIANPPATFVSGGTSRPFTAPSLASALENSVLQDLESLLRTEQLASPQTTRPYAGINLPMTGLSDAVTGIDEYTVITNDGSQSQMVLTRAVAKAHVEVASGVSDFYISGTGAYQVAADGSLYRYGTAIGTPSGSLTNYLSSANEVLTSSLTNALTTAAEPLYLYETGDDKASAVIVKGLYGGIIYYYKLAFVADAVAQQITRNVNYIFRITQAATGYTTLQEALQSPPLNEFHYEIEVIDATGHDIVTNGTYYLALSNSNVLVYGGMTTLDNAFVVTTDATAAMGVGPGTITATSGLSLSTSTVKIDGTATPVTVTMSSATTSGTVTISVGSLRQTVSFSRYPRFNFMGFGELPADDYVNCEVESEYEWLKLMDEEYVPFTGNKTFSGPQRLFITADINRTENFVREAVFFTARAGNGGRSKVFVRQVGRDLNFHGVSHTVPENAYVGAFWRCSQTGERLIKIPYSDRIKGQWSAAVVEGEDWIRLDLKPTMDIGATFDPLNENPADMIARDAEFPVTGLARSVGGNVSGPDDEIYFRIGLTGTIPEDGEPRYGVIFITIEQQDTGNSIYWRIFIRQGEQDDYLMRPEDLTYNGVSFGTPNRPYANKIPVFNLTAQQYRDDPEYMTASGGTAVSHHPQLAVRSGVFTLYPTQIGAIFQWQNSQTTTARRAYHPTVPLTALSGWSNTYTMGAYWPELETEHELCPEKYRRPMDHIGLTTTTTHASIDPATSEWRQSLFYNPNAATGSMASNGTSQFGGKYADGFYDRRAIQDDGTGAYVNLVAPTTTYAAAPGTVFYNPFNHASIFFPFGSSRSGTANGVVSLAGSVGNYWMTSPSGSYTRWSMGISHTSPTSYNNMASVYMSNQYYPYNAFTIRCVPETEGNPGTTPGGGGGE